MTELADRVLILAGGRIIADDTVDGLDLLPPSVALPSILGALITFGVVIGPAYSLAWAIIAMFLTPMVLRRMSRRQSGSQVEAAREAAVQWIR